jgi:hypothetical protein
MAIRLGDWSAASIALSCVLYYCTTNMPAYVALLRECISLSKEIALNCDLTLRNLALEVARESTMSYGRVWPGGGGADM